MAKQGKEWRDDGRPRRRWRGRDVHKRRGRVPVEEVLDELLQRHIPGELRRLTRIRELWPTILPASFADYVWPMLVQGPRLLVHVHDSQWLHEMTYWRQEVLDRLEQAWPEAEITTVEAFVGPLPPLSERRPEPEPVPEPKVREAVLDPEVPDETMDALKQVEDASLRDVLARARMMLGRPAGPDQ